MRTRRIVRALQRAAFHDALRASRRGAAPWPQLMLAALALAAWPAAEAATEPAPAAEPARSDWQQWQAGSDVSNLGSLQRGARDFMGYCSGCHSLKYLRYKRLGDDLSISEEQLTKYLVPAGAKPADYITSAMPAADAESWFGKVPPDLSLEARLRGPDWIYEFLKTFYADRSRATGVNNLRFENAAMPHVLAELQGVQTAVFRNVEVKGEGGSVTTRREFDHFEQSVPGRLSAEEYDGFVRDLVNFLDYVGEPAQIDRRQLGVWVVLFLLAFTWIAWLLKKEYWRDVH
jgi:ubiquinol-cytochrome c reductase cytochrome c1 subunit